MTKFAVIILSHKRAERIDTLNTLKKHGYTGDIYIVIDDEDPQKEQYHALHKNIVEFSKKEYSSKVDTMDNFNRQNIVLYARQAVWDIAKGKGLSHFLVLDDDYTFFAYKYIGVSDIKYNRYLNNVLSLDKVFEFFLQFLDSTRVTCIAFAQGGDFIGGYQGSFGDKYKWTRKVMNSFFCRTDRPFTFIGSINEDTNAYLTEGARGKIFFTNPLIALQQKQTQSNSGGLTDIYKDLGTYVKSFYSVICAPSCVKINAMGDKYYRLHHHVSWNNAVPKILSPIHKK